MFFVSAFLLDFLVSGAPVVPTNLQVDTGRNARDVIVAWDPIEEAANYTVRVKLKSLCYYIIF